MQGGTLRRLPLVAGAALLLVVAALLAASTARSDVGGTFAVHMLNSDQPGVATHQDPDLVNGWGIAAPPTGPWWVADNGSDKSTLYSADGTKQGLVVNIVNGAPTGTVFNGTSDFVVTNGTSSGPARFIFASESGTISGWNPSVDPTNSVVGVRHRHSVFKGLAIAQAASGMQLYATNFNLNRVDVFNSTFGPGVATGHFTDPNLPPGYGPFGIQAVNGMIIVTFAKHMPGSTDEAHGPGLGIIDAFDTDGHLLARVGTHTGLNAPWGIAMAPANFGDASGDLLVGNFGDGKINAFAQRGDDWKRVGYLRDHGDHPLSIDGLWGIGFGNGATAGPTNTLYFAAGPNDEADGLFGSITAN